MSPTTPKRGTTKTSADTSAAVDRFMTDLRHPHKDAVEALRHVVCAAHHSIAEGVKWNAPSFRTTEYFATTHLRAKAGIGVILHLGARRRADPSVSIADPGGLLDWLAKDRAMVTFAGLDDLTARAAAFQDIVRQWITHV
jgi:hypothetical protein